MKVILAVLAACILISGNCYAHQDQIITIANDGTLEGIPSEYGPARLQVEFAPREAGSDSISAVVLTLGKHTVRVPLCACRVIKTQGMDTIAATASWYHDEKLLPFYLQIYFFDPGYNSSKWENPGPGYSMLFNLHTAKLITMEESIVHNNGKTVQYVPVDVASKCRSNGTDEFLSADR